MWIVGISGVLIVRIRGVECFGCRLLLCIFRFRGVGAGMFARLFRREMVSLC